VGRLEPHRNHIGVESREPLVVRADRWVREEGLRNCHFLYGNINVSVESLLRGYPVSFPPAFPAWHQHKASCGAKLSG
jgi:tRNA (guanine-N7-)-methyltransferase